MLEPAAILTLGIIILTCCVSFVGFKDRAFEAKHIFCPEYILAHKQYYRLITSAFLHSGVTHLALNMVSFYFFAEGIELIYGKMDLLVIYFGAILGGSLLSLFIHRHHEYLAYGASGGVSGIIFASIFLLPGGSVHLFLLPIGIPSWLYAILFLGGTFYAMKSDRDNIGHDSHLGGAISGLAIAALLHPQIVVHRPLLFSVVIAASVGMLLYIARNPLFLPLHTFKATPLPSRSPKAFFRQKSKAFKTDELLDKISKNGIQSLTDAERNFLKGVSEKFRRRAESKKPDSELFF